MQSDLREALREFLAFGHPREGSARYHAAWEKLAALQSLGDSPDSGARAEKVKCDFCHGHGALPSGGGPSCPICLGEGWIWKAGPPVEAPGDSLRESEEPESVRQRLEASLRFFGVPQAPQGPRSREAAEGSKGFTCPSCFWPTYERPSESTLPVPQAAGREIWMLEVRGILDPRYWSTSQADAEEYITGCTWKPQERPRLVRMVESPAPEKGSAEA